MYRLTRVAVFHYLNLVLYVRSEIGAKHTANVAQEIRSASRLSTRTAGVTDN